jgi:hypothetical protein
MALLWSRWTAEGKEMFGVGERTVKGSPMTITLSSGQFHQCSMCSFYLRKLWVQLFCAYILGLYFTGISLPAQKLCIECWWNWALITAKWHLTFVCQIGIIMMISSKFGQNFFFQDCLLKVLILSNWIWL